MGTTFRVVLHAPDQASAGAASRRAFARIAELDATLTDYKATSELSRVTREAVGHPVRVSGDLLGVLMPSQELARDPMARSTSRWGRSRACGAVRGARSNCPRPTYCRGETGNRVSDC